MATTETEINCPIIDKSGDHPEGCGLGGGSGRVLVIETVEEDEESNG
jgi:hypothetical protein